MYDEIIDELFQFHKVRLKVVNALASAIIGEGFQFHKVRLKALLMATGLGMLNYFNSIRYD